MDNLAATILILFLGIFIGVVSILVYYNIKGISAQNNANKYCPYAGQYLICPL